MTQDNIRALDQLRQRLSLLATSIGSLRADLERNEPLPTWPSLQSSAQALSFNLQQLSETFQSHRQFLKQAHAYPLPTFPGQVQEGLLGQLLRKKLEPGAEDWVDEYAIKFDELVEEDGLKKSELNDLWSWAASASAGIVRPMLEDDGAFEDDFTIAERQAGVERVVTGLRRKLDGQEDVDEDEADDIEDEDKMEDVVAAAPALTNQLDARINSTLPAIPIEDLLKFTSTGTTPANSGRTRA